jgi:hypothetical protein
VDGSYLFFQDLQIRSNLPKSTTVIYFMIRALGVSNLKPCFSPYANILESMIYGHQSLSIDGSPSTLGIWPFNQIDSSMAPSSINGRDLLRVSGLLKSQISNLCSRSDDLDSLQTIQCLRYSSDYMTIEIYFG